MTIRTERLLAKYVIALAATLCLGILTASTAKAAAFFNEQTTSNAFLGVQIPNPLYFEAKGVGVANIGPSGTIAFPAQTSAMGNALLTVNTPNTWKYTDGAGNLTLPPYRTYVTGGHPACINLGAITGNQMPASPGGAPGIHATPNSIYCGLQIGMNAGTLAPGGGLAAAGPFKWCKDDANPGNNGPCTLTDGGGNPLSPGQQPMFVRYEKTPGAAALGGTYQIAGDWNVGVRLSNPFTPAGGYFQLWGIVPLNMIGGTAGNVVQVVASVTHETLGFKVPGPVTEVGLPYTTGMVTVDYWLSVPTAMVALRLSTQFTGFDNRTTTNYEVGDVQLISGFLQKSNVFGAITNASFAFVMDVKFVPEPATTGLLAAGVLALPAIFWRRNRKRE